jgi:flagellar biosynthesis protein FlhB
MSDDESRTLPPTQRRIADALARGQCARSPVAVAALSIAASFTLVATAASGVASWSAAFLSAVQLVAAGQLSPAVLYANALTLLENSSAWFIVAGAWAGAVFAALLAARRVAD